MPELPEVEAARLVIEQHALRRTIVDVDDSDAYVCRPHAPGEMRAALVGRALTAAHRTGKSMWCPTSGVDGSSEPGPVLGIHLGMSGRIVFGDGTGHEVDGGDYWERGRAEGDHRFTRFSLRFADGTYLMLIDPRRLSRARLDPPVEKLGPDAASITPAQFRAALSRGTAPVKARLLDQEAIAGVGNILADEALWLAKIHPARPVNKLSRAATDRLGGAVRQAVASAIEGGGVHTLTMVDSRRPDGRCPRCGTLMKRGTVGGRTTWWCPREQR
ncbi:MAG TPA: DNA-formamidopyrimidine glycosylase family protein [Micromonosporaceae bacterium]|nr:DNA-formamidopyrimidine glycosylase family protein [Micromonosporaceae bacterium]